MLVRVKKNTTMKIRIPIVIVLMSFFINCNSVDAPCKSIESSLMNEFDKEEIKELKEILVFFDNIVSAQTKINSIDSAYHHYIENLRLSESKGEFETKLLMDKPRIDSFMNEYKKNKIFDKIWKIEYGTDIIRKDTLSSVIIPNQQGAYFILLDKAIENDKIFNEYKNSLITCGEIGPDLVVRFQFIHESLDFNNEIIRLITAIHYISVNTYTEVD